MADTPRKSATGSGASSPAPRPATPPLSAMPASAARPAAVLSEMAPPPAAQASAPALSAMAPPPAKAVPAPAQLSAMPAAAPAAAAAAAAPAAAAAAGPGPFMMGDAGMKKHSKKAGEVHTTEPRRVPGRRGKPAAMVDTTVRQKTTLQRHLARLNSGEGAPTGDVVQTGMGDAQVFALPTRTKGRAPSLYARKPDGGTFPIPPRDGADYASSDDESH